MPGNRSRLFLVTAPAVFGSTLTGSGGSLLTASSAPEGAVPGSGLLFFGILFLGIGLVSFLYPRLFWWLRIGRRVKDVVPNSLYLMTIRLGGLLLCAVALLILFKAI